MYVEPVEEEVLDGGPDPERHVALSVEHRRLRSAAAAVQYYRLYFI